MIGIALPCAAHPYDLEELLNLPLERLLTLEITSRGIPDLTDDSERARPTFARLLEKRRHAP